MARFFIENYGCQMNVSEADSLREALIDQGHTEAATARECDVAIINTCSVRNTAGQRIRGRLGFYRGIKDNEGIAVKVILMGCMAQNEGLPLKKAFPDVLKLVWGTYNKNGIADYLTRLENAPDYLDQSEFLFTDATPQKRFPFKSFVPISHGCNNFCTYCIVPHVRSREIHRPHQEILDNIRKLADRGVIEITLLGQNVNSYHDGTLDFPSLLRKIARETTMPRISFLTSHPKDFSEALSDVISEYPSIARSLHLPLQAGSNRVLQGMNRRYTLQDFLKKAELARRTPGLTLSTDLIVGFPGETDGEFRETLAAVKEIRFQEAFMYHYNPRPGTAAATLPHQVPEPLRLERLAELIELQLAISHSLLEERAGQTESVLFESFSRKNNNQIGGRSHSGIMVYCQGNPGQIGQIHPVKTQKVSGAGLSGILLSHEK